MFLSDTEISYQIATGKIGIDPLPSQITGVSVDLHLGDRFRVVNDNTEYDLSVWRDAVNNASKRLNMLKSKEDVLMETDVFFLEPGQLVLAATVETVTIPDSLVGWLDGRSSLARLGLMVHVTAHRIDPGFNGKIVLECFNVGKRPLALRHGMAICAISFAKISGKVDCPYNKRPDAQFREQYAL